MSSLTRIQLENYLKTIDVKGSVLDVGGSQSSIRGRTKSWDVDNYKILDLPQPHKGDKPDYAFDIQEYMLGHKINERFDNIFCMEVTEYLYDPWRAIYNMGRLLKKDGHLYISFHFIYPQHPPEKLDYLRYTPAGVESRTYTKSYRKNTTRTGVVS